MAFFDLVSRQYVSSVEPKLDLVNVLDSHIGKGVYAVRPYPDHSVIGEITGEIFSGAYTGTSYTFEADEGNQLEPSEPFRYLNHSCEPNCEFDWLDEPSVHGEPAKSGLFLLALRDIQAYEQLTIDYSWPATFAIPCRCEAARCRGWVVAVEELDKLQLQG
ncbi:MAG: SET domain-containing protein-lysine N-methyltransferase [Mariniblastus sp.]|nr:SET domain-containing protein-lysine N-methyltransferase [Mariniblastus sp.]